MEGKHMNTSDTLLNEIKYYISFSALKRLLLKGDISQKDFDRVNVAVAKLYGVLLLHI